MTEGPQSGALTELLLDEDRVHKSLVPDDVVIRDYLSCINDDTWVRRAELVQIETLKETPGGEEMKQEVLRTYIDERATKGVQRAPDPILEGIYWQERFMEEYKKDQRSQDKKDAGNYKQTLLSSFRLKRPNQTITSGQTASYLANNAIEYRPEPESDKAAATEFKKEEKQASPKAPAAAVAAAPVYPTDGAAADEKIYESLPPADTEAADYEIGENKTHEKPPTEETSANNAAAELELDSASKPVVPATTDEVKPVIEAPTADNPQFEMELGESAEKPTENLAQNEEDLHEM